MSSARIISATNRSAKSLIEDGAFREDLYYRLNVIPIEVPPLRSRRDDIPLLVEHFLEYFCTRHRRDNKRMSPEAMAMLLASSWPGNVRQLRNVVERMVITSIGDVIDAKELPKELCENPATSTAMPNSLAEAIEDCEKKTIKQALDACNLHRENTAKVLGISVRTLHYKMSRYGLH